MRRRISKTIITSSAATEENSEHFNDAFTACCIYTMKLVSILSYAATNGSEYMVAFIRSDWIWNSSGSCII